MHVRNKYYFVQDFDPALDYQDGTVVSLMPEVSEVLSRSGIPYKIPEDYYQEEDLRKEEEAYFFEQLDWLGRFEEHLRLHVSLCKTHHLELARICFNRLKYFMDPVIIQCRILASMVQQVSKVGGTIVYVKENKTEDRIWVENSHWSRAATHFDRFLPLICEREGRVPCTFHSFGVGDHTKKLGKPVLRGWNSAMDRLARAILKRGYHIFKYHKWIPRKKNGRLKGRSFLFLHANAFALDVLMRKLVREGARVFYRSGGSFLLLNDWFERACGRVTDASGGGSQDKIRQDCEEAARSLTVENKELISWLNAKAGIDLTEYFTDYFHYFLAEVCPKLLSEIADYKNFYHRQKIDFVVSHTSSDYPAKSAILAARIAGVETVCLQHGCDIYRDRSWEMTDLDTFDIYFATDSLSETRFRKAAGSKHIHSPRVFQYPAYLDSIQQSRSCAGFHSSRCKPATILYIPSKTALHYRTFNCMVYPPLWYFEFQNRILDYFSTRWSDINFIYKHSGRDADSALLQKIKENIYPNVSFDERRTLDCFKDVNAVILDRPTTAFFEATASGLPTLCLYPDFLGGMIDPESAKYFSKTLKAFMNVEEAAEAIQDLLNHPEEFVQKLPCRFDPVIDILKKEECALGSNRFQKISLPKTGVIV